MWKQWAISERPLASFSKWVLVPILSYEKEISFACKLNYFSYEWLWTNKEALIRQIGNGRLCSNKELRHKIENSKYDNWRMYYSAHPRELVLSFLNYHVHNTWKWVVVCQSAQWSYIPYNVANMWIKNCTENTGSNKD